MNRPIGESGTTTARWISPPGCPESMSRMPRSWPGHAQIRVIGLVRSRFYTCPQHNSFHYKGSFQVCNPRNRNPRTRKPGHNSNNPLRPTEKRPEWMSHNKPQRMATPDHGPRPTGDSSLECIRHKCNAGTDRIPLPRHLPQTHEDMRPPAAEERPTNRPKRECDFS